MIKGSCLCGRVQFEILGEVGKSSHCYCQMCRKGHGAAFASYTNLRREQINYKKGQALISVFVSSPGVERTFCRVCGSNLEWRRMDSEKTAIAMGSFDSPFDPGDIEAVCPEDKVNWL